MGTKEMPEDNELKNLMEAYEKAKAENKQLYLDGHQFADIANWYIDRFEYEKVKEVTDYGLRFHPDDIELLVTKVQYFLNLDDIEGAKTTIDRIPDIYLSTKRFLKAEIYYREDNFPEAKRMLEENIDKIPDVQILTDSVNLLIDMEYPDQAIEFLDRYENRFKGDQTYLKYRADCMVRLYKFNKAIATYNKLIDQSPYNTSYWIGLAKCHVVQGHYKKAIEACDFALATDSQNGEAYLIKGNSYFYMNNEEKTIENMQKALEYNCSILEAPYMLMGISYLNMKKPRKALELLEKAIEVLKKKECDEKDTYSELYHHAINAAIELNNYEKAHQLCEEALQLIPGSLLFKPMKGLLYLHNEQEEEAHRFFEKLIQENPDDFALINEIAQTYENCKHYKEAKFYYKKIFAKKPSYPGVAEALTNISMREKDFESFSLYNQACKQPIKQSIANILMKENANDKDVEEGLLELMDSLKTIFQNNRKNCKEDEKSEDEDFDDEEDFEETDNK